MRKSHDGAAARDPLPDLTVRQLRAIVAVGRSGKFTAAAVELGLSQPGLSRAIQQAEAALGVELFARRSRRVVRTAAGRVFLPAAARLLDEIAQQTRAVRDLAGPDSGPLVVASLMSVSHHLLPAALARFRARHPAVPIRLHEGLQGHVEALVRGGIAGPPSARGEIAVETLIEEPCLAVLPAAHRLAGRCAIGLGDLARECLVSMPTESGLRQAIDAEAARRGVGLRHAVVVDQFATLFDFVARGLGVGVAPVTALPPATLPVRIAAVALRPALRRRIGVLCLADRPLSLVATAFLEILRPMLREAAGG
ncbi:MAG: LysR family transcriptional regulator [Rhodospirillales bacterium]|nr:LysR family transcriptional regulator [Rhodospirillales bacterium]